MALQIRSRPEYESPLRLRPVTNGFIHSVRPDERSFDPDENTDDATIPSTTLPILATANDARELVRFLKKRPNGVTIVEAMNAEPRRIFDARKIAAYEFWGIIGRENERLVLTPLGEELAEALGPECRMHRDILHRVPEYQTAIKNIYDEGLDIATHLDVLRYWSDMNAIPPSVHANAHDLEAAVVCFFSLCHAAELGTSTVGKRGQPARLRVDINQVESFLAGEVGPSPSIHISGGREPVRQVRPTVGLPIMQVLVSTSGPRQDVEHLNSLLALAGFENRTVDFAGSENGLLPSNDLEEMQKCQAGIFVFSPLDCVRNKDGKFSLRHEWITKVSVAAALFDWRILLFWNGELPPPEELTASGLRIAAKEELDWEASLGLVNQIKELAFPLSE